MQIMRSHSAKCLSNLLIILNRVKVEQLSKKPRILLFHDVYLKGEIDSIKKAAQKTFEYSISCKTGQCYVKVDNRVSLTGDVDLKREKLDRIYKWVELETDMPIVRDNIANMFVNYYGVGGFANLHYDIERIGTWLSCISEVEAGGYTTFSRVGVSVKAKSGSAILWYTYRDDDSTDKRMIHAGCPVLLGDKWISGVWVRARPFCKKK